MLRIKFGSNFIVERQSCEEAAQGFRPLLVNDRIAAHILSPCN